MPGFRVQSDFFVFTEARYVLLLLLTFLIVFSPLALGFGLAVSLRPLYDERQQRLVQAKEMQENSHFLEQAEKPESLQEAEAEAPVENDVEAPVVDPPPEMPPEPPAASPEAENTDPAPSVPQEREPNALEKAIEEVGREILKEEDAEKPDLKTARKIAEEPVAEPAAEPVSKAPFDPNEILSNMISGEDEDAEAQPGEPGVDLGQNDVELPAGEEVDADMLQQLMNRLGTTPATPHVPHEIPDISGDGEIMEDASLPTKPFASLPESEPKDVATGLPDSTEPSEELEIEPNDPTTSGIPLVNEILGGDFDVDSLVEPTKEVETPKTAETDSSENEETTETVENTETATIEGPAQKSGNEEKSVEKRVDGTEQHLIEQPELGVVETDGPEGIVAFVATEPETAASYRVVQEALGESPTGLTESREIMQNPLPGGMTTVFSASMLRLRRKKQPAKED